MSDRESIEYDAMMDKARTEMEEHRQAERAFWMATALPCPNCNSRGQLGGEQPRDARVEISCGECCHVTPHKGIGRDWESAVSSWNASVSAAESKP